MHELEAAVEGSVIADEDTRTGMSSDFGRLVNRMPRFVVAPACVRDVENVLKLADQEGVPISTRGAAHSQSGQSLVEDGILIDLTTLKRIDPVVEAKVWVDAGVVWGDLVRMLALEGWVPPVLTNNLSVTVGGTLSMAGLGVASHRFGAQVDNVAALEVVTADGQRVVCSPSENQDLFNCSRCGLGQFSVIVRAELKLRQLEPKVRTFFLLYDDIEALMRDQEFLLHRQHIDYVESWCSPCPQGLRKMGPTRLPFAEWFYPMHLTVEYSSEPPDADKVLEGLSFYRKSHVEDITTLEYLFRLEPLFEMWRDSGTWNLTHPWMEVVLPWVTAGRYIRGVLQDFPPHLLVGGHVLLWPCRGTASDAPMFMHPGGDFVMGFGILPAIPKRLTGQVLPLLQRASDLSMEVGGKRYLSGWVDFDEGRWKSHFGEKWEQVVAWKRFYDPKGILNPGFIKY